MQSKTTKDTPLTSGAAAFQQPSKEQAIIETPCPFPGLKFAASSTLLLAVLQLKKET